VSDAELTNYINSSIKELYDILVQEYDGEYYVSEYEFTTTDSKTYDLPSDFYKLKGVDMKINNSNFYTLKQFNFNERNRYTENAPNSPYSFVRYRLQGGKLAFTPKPGTGKDTKIWYIPLATELVDDSDTFDGINGYEEYVIVDAAIKMLLKEESDASALYQMKADLSARITQAAANRNAGEPQSVSDIYAENNWYWWSVD
jgi:hypothetical protein